MNLMFLCSMEKETEEGRVRTAQVSIAESKGVWFVQWNEVKQDGREVEESWFEGVDWQEMLAAFRERMDNKQNEGFKPFIEWNTNGADELDGRNAFIQMLYFYSDINSNEELYESLRRWRFQQAGREGKAPFIIASNRLLKMISAFIPKTEEELLQLPGFGSTKSAMYSAEILTITAAYESCTNFPLTWVSSTVDHAQFRVWLKQEKDKKRKAEADKKEIKRKLLESISSGKGLDELQEQTGMHRRNLLIWIEELDREGYDLENYVGQMLELIPTEQRERAWSAFEQQGDRYLKPILQTIFKLEELSAKETNYIYEWLRLLRIQFRHSNKYSTGEATSA